MKFAIKLTPPTSALRGSVSGFAAGFCTVVDRATSERGSDTTVLNDTQPCDRSVLTRRSNQSGSRALDERSSHVSQCQHPPSSLRHPSLSRSLAFTGEDIKMTSTTQPPPSPTAFRQLPSLSSLSRLCSPPSNETLPIYNHAKMSYPPVHTFPSCAQMASSQPAPLQHHHLSPPQPPSMPAKQQSPSSITTLLHACSAASHEMLNSPPAAPELVRVKAEPTEDASSLSRRSSAADSLYSGNASDSRSMNGSALGSSYSYVAGESAWPGGSLSPSTNGAGLALGSASNSKLQKEDMEDRKMVKSTSPDSVGSGEGSVCSGKTLKQTSESPNL